MVLDWILLVEVGEELLQRAILRQHNLYVRYHYCINVKLSDFFFFLSRASPTAYGSSQAKSGIELQLQVYATATATRDRAVFATYTTGQDSVRSLTH